MADSDRNIVFYIPHYRSNMNIVKLLNYCVRSIQEHYPLSDIVVCESPSTLENSAYDISGVVWVENPIPNSACIGCYKDYLNRYRDSKKKGIFLHDTMMMKGRFSEDLLDTPFKFIWRFDGHLKEEVLSVSIRNDLFIILGKNDMDFTDYDGCFGWALQGNYESIHTLWNSIPFERYMNLPVRSEVMKDMERIIGVTAFSERLVESIENCSLCGNIFHYGGGFGSAYNNESYEEIQSLPCKDVCVKFWGGRTNEL